MSRSGRGVDGFDDSGPGYFGYTTASFSSARITGHRNPAIEGAAMIEGVAAVQNPAVTGIGASARRTRRCDGHRRRTTPVPMESGFGPMRIRAGFPVGTVLTSFGPWATNHVDIAVARSEGAWMAPRASAAVTWE